MSNTLRLWLAVPILATGLGATMTPADAQWHHGGGYNRGYGGGYHRGYGGGYRDDRHRGVGGALIGGLAAGALIGALGAGLYANSQPPPPPVVYAPPPQVYAEPPPGAYGPPGGGYAQPGYYGQPGY